MSKYLDGFSDDELIEELSYRGLNINRTDLNIIETDLLDRLEANIKDIDLNALELFLQEYGV